VQVFSKVNCELINWNDRWEYSVDICRYYVLLCSKCSGGLIDWNDRWRADPRTSRKRDGQTRSRDKSDLSSEEPNFLSSGTSKRATQRFYSTYPTHLVGIQLNVWSRWFSLGRWAPYPSGSSKIWYIIKIKIIALTV
jgi:hypothetical protein